MDNLELLFYRWLGGHITGREYFTELVIQPKPWTTAKWKQIRNLILKSQCENCGKTGKLVLSHDWHPDAFPVTYAKIASESDPDFAQKFDAYIKQFYSEKGFRRPGLEVYRKEPTATDLHVLEQHFLLKNYWNPELESSIAKKALIEQFLQTRRYWSMADVRTLCQGCAYHVDKKKGKI